MGISIIIILAILFLVFMTSLKNVDEATKNTTLLIGIVIVGYILIKVIWG